jgi:3'-phosphoadenosine 5'-phosphosulfate sulfotransferase (PAPS reductase)/FAD synthetase
VNDLKECVREFFKILDSQEESEEGRMFHPVTINCCRAMMIEPLNKLLDRMKELSNE